MPEAAVIALAVAALAAAVGWALCHRRRQVRRAHLQQLVEEIGRSAAEVDRQITLLRERVVQGAQGLPNALAYRGKLQDIEQLATRVIGYSERARELLAASGGGSSREMEVAHGLLTASLKLVEHLRMLVDTEVSLLLVRRPYLRNAPAE